MDMVPEGLRLAVRPTLCFVAVDEKNWLLVSTAAAAWYFPLWPLYSVDKGYLLNDCLFPRAPAEVALPALLRPFGLWRSAEHFPDEEDGSGATAVLAAMRDASQHYGSVLVNLQVSGFLPMLGMIKGLDRDLVEECMERRSLRGAMRAPEKPHIVDMHEWTLRYLAATRDYAVHELVPGNALRPEFVYAAHGGRLAPCMQAWNAPALEKHA